MHEASIVMSILDNVINQCHREGYTSVSSVTVKIGSGSCVMPEALQFAFQVARQDTLAANAELIIQEIPLGGVCRQCGKDVEVENKYIFTCPLCNDGTIEFTQGYELDLVEMEVE